MATDENNHKNEARDDWTGCTFRVERGPSSEGRAWGMADILTDVPRRVWPARPGISPRRPARDRARPRRRLTPPAQAFAGHPACRFLFSPALIRSSQSNPTNHVFQFVVFRE